MIPWSDMWSNKKDFRCARDTSFSSYLSSTFVIEGLEPADPLWDKWFLGFYTHSGRFGRIIGFDRFKMIKIPCLRLWFHDHSSRESISSILLFFSKLAYLFNMSIYPAVQNKSISMSMDLMNPTGNWLDQGISLYPNYAARADFTHLFMRPCGSDTKSSSYP